MSDDGVDHELLALLRQKFGLGGADPNAPPETKVLEHAQFIYDNSIDVALSMAHTKLAAIAVSEEMQKREYSTKTWSEHELHPKAKDEATINFIFTMDLLNFSFWSEKSDEQRFTVDYKGKKWTGYWSLVASLQRALDEGIPITSPKFWIDEGKDENVARRNVGPASADGTQPSWSDPQAPRLPNEAFNTGVYPDPPAPRLPNESFDTGVYPDPPSSQQLTTSVLTDTDNVPRENTPEAEDEHDDTDVWSDALEAQSEEVEGLEESPMPKEETPSTPERVRCTEDVLRHVFRSCTAEEIPMFSERVKCLREAGRILHEHFDGSVVTLIQDAKGSAGGLVNLLADRFACFRDESTYERKKVRFLKRAQIFVADLWAAFEGEGYGQFNDIDKITMFADYRVPQILHSLGLISYCPPLEGRIRRGEMIESGHSWELQIRGCSIWAIELLRREILKIQPDAKVNAILLDFFLYDLAKEKENAGDETLPHHRTRSIWY
ncbi:hypothetical protein P171DRAFT_519046 [Karstenula rhodostoma CBS 690.94]|uniref:Queuosine 5'-phosphate N-glycosylase/hydrolase n=1 Tax=Karstenula rhodostoma CBS 690.94 TaxID=1392251 RepID=A0A9P4UF19_9PLEO|nr:hypothetical protein P171DRAFT_519046 [Karstenula rhodostoma CBS 690.94]